MNSEPSCPAPHGGDPRPKRLFLYEPGWRVGLKTGSTREFCYVMAPGQDYYHRLHDGEIFLRRGDERICLACAERRGLIAYGPKGLRTLVHRDLDIDDSNPEIDLSTIEVMERPA